MLKNNKYVNKNRTVMHWTLGKQLLVVFYSCNVAVLTVMQWPNFGISIFHSGFHVCFLMYRMPRGITPVRARRRQSDAKWRASVAMCYNVMKNVIPNSKKIGKTSKRKLSKVISSFSTKNMWILTTNMYVMSFTKTYILFLQSVSVLVSFLSFLRFCL